MHTALIWCIAAGSIAGILLRPRNLSEAVWACIGAALLVVSGLIPPAQAGAAVAKGTDVYLFLTGMMLLSELARQEGVFDWLASLAVAASRASRARLFALVYLVGTIVTVFLSNDATAVVLTPAVYAAVKRARTEALPYLFICGFIANAASFVLPISNPANLVVYGKQLPPLLEWLHTFLLPSVCSIAVTYYCLRLTQKKHLGGKIEDAREPVVLSKAGRLSSCGIVVTGAVLITASAFGRDLGLPTSIAGAVTVLIATRASLQRVMNVVRGVSWSVLPLVAGLFVLVEALNYAGAAGDVAGALRWCESLPRFAGALMAAFGIAGLSNVMNNLPSGLLAGSAVQALNVTSYIRDAVLIGIDLGPNLSVTGSLATILWLIALRREGEQVSAWRFLKVGFIVMPPALLLSTLAMVLLAK